MKMKGLIPLWDEYVADRARTNAVLSVNQPERAGSVFVCDAPWEGDCDFFNIVKDDGLYRMYYILKGPLFKGVYPGLMIGYAESKDGLHWVKPPLGIYEYNGSRDNNILLGPDSKELDYECNGLFVMKDPNPDCEKDAKYKALMNYYSNGRYNLRCLASEDGIHFREWRMIADQTTYAFDTLNVLSWDSQTKKYHCYIRTIHTKKKNAVYPDSNFAEEGGIRAVSVMESSDFVTWSEPVALDFSGKDDYPLYCACVSPYLYDDRYMIGFPVRYVERKAWTDNFDQLCGREFRIKRMENVIENGEPTLRHGTAITDCVFMFSRDHYHWYRFDEACLTPGPEQPYKWVYGDCYAAVGMIETPARFELEPNELSLYVEMYNWGNRPTELMRYVYRKDGFASYKAGYEAKTFQTKPFEMEGERLFINFRTSARGNVYAAVLDEGDRIIDGYESCELFGDTLEREIRFCQPLSALRGKTVKLRFTMRDAEIFSFTVG